MSRRFWSFVTAIALLSLVMGVAITPVAAQDGSAESVEELCPSIVSLQEFTIEQIDDYTRQVSYQTANGVAFTLTISVPSDSPVDPVALIDEFLGEVRLCLEVVTREQLEKLLVPEDVVGVPLGDHFYETMESYLSLLEFTQGYYSGEFTEDDLWTVYSERLNTGLNDRGLDATTAQQEAYDSAYALLQQAYDNGELTDAAFAAASADVERMYTDAFNPNPEDTATVPLADVGDEFMFNGVINIDIAITAPEELGLEEYGIVLVFDPRLPFGRRNRFTVSPAQSMQISSLCASFGSVNATLKNGSSNAVQPFGESDATSACASTPVVTANKLCVDGVRSSNTYALASTYWNYGSNAVVPQERTRLGC